MEDGEELCFCGCYRPRSAVLMSTAKTQGLTPDEADKQYTKAKANWDEMWRVLRALEVSG